MAAICEAAGVYHESMTNCVVCLHICTPATKPQLPRDETRVRRGACMQAVPVPWARRYAVCGRRRTPSRAAWPAKLAQPKMIACPGWYRSAAGRDTLAIRPALAGSERRQLQMNVACMQIKDLVIDTPPTQIKDRPKTIRQQAAGPPPLTALTQIWAPTPFHGDASWGE